ncbi:TetR family transcriptional regulator [Streptomyces sp. SL13]|uniref:TetR family transcriptional regulator n=1 Tax=Streptantibioticus silvisoli TaxID=2705255 RepID=A0AA90H7B7_9ACTN|nr:TetR/AcrR family transcriptional regulator [Streptantibioticus silvisoli]MDI5966861.1 TetR family transcriptional regulator [Streptantibioticus silvisoli]MDI5970130.1 TetR family transcriptional regulator [Streptantibioticus silvisoli]
MTKPMRADARRNYQRLVEVATTAFAEHGADAPLEDIARRAQVGIGTLYRHFPDREELMAAVFQGELDALVTLAEQLRAEQPALTALNSWLRAVVAHTTAYRGLGRSLMAARAASMGVCQGTLRAAAAELLTGAQQAGQVRADARVDDLMHLACAIALAAERSPQDPRLADRLLDLAVEGLRTRAEE